MDVTLPDGAPATLVRPAGVPVGGVIVAHGGSADGRRFFLDEAAELAEGGLLVVLPATSLPDHGDITVTTAAINRAVGTYRHALDLLDEQLPDDRASGFFGHSAGAFLGTLLAATDPRPRRLVLAGYGCGALVRLAAQDVVDAGYLAALERFDPRNHLAGHGERVFVQHGREDTTVFMEEARRLYEAAGPGARWAEYDCGHAIDIPAARRDRLAYLT
jgi:pimeloyl-ACP methyl ester carboxylesterase